LADQIPKLQKLNDNKKTFNLDHTVSYVIQYMCYMCSKDTIPLQHHYIQPFLV